MSDDVKAMNEAIADDYSAHVYDPVVIPHLDIEQLFGVAGLFGELGRPADVLDIGCGTGVQLARLAEQVSGRLVGIDISPEPVRIARERLAPYGERAKVHCADLLEFALENLGQFDVILNIGVIYVTPPAVQRRILEVIGKCLRPGGVAVISYHAGTVPALRTNLHRMLYAGLEGLSPADALASARARAAEIAPILAGIPGTELQRETLEITSSQSDLIFYHEVFNPCFGPLQTTVLSRDLSDHGVEFAWYLARPGAGGLNPTSESRALAADLTDFINGQYRYGVFAKYLNSGACDVTREHLVLDALVARNNPGQFDGEQVFTSRDGANSATMRSPVSMAMVDCLAEGPLNWSALCARTATALRGEGASLSDDEKAMMAADAHLLWNHGLLDTLFRPGG